MQAKHLLEFPRAPGVWSMYPRMMMSRKPALVPEGGEVPRIEARLGNVVVDRKHLAAYAKICNAPVGDLLPIAYPHVLAMPLHVAMLGAEAFPVKVFGLVHVANRIAMRGPLAADEPAEIFSWIEGHRDTARGQEFELHTEYRVGGETRWDETCIFLARRRAPAGMGGSTTTTMPVNPPENGVAVESCSFVAPAGVGRRYGLLSRDLNPIHLSNLTARAFGFPRAIVHGMWSLARVAAEFEPDRFEGGCEIEVAFRLPIYMPASLALVRWPVDDGSAFVLRDAPAGKPHLTGTLRSRR